QLLGGARHGGQLAHHADAAGGGQVAAPRHLVEVGDLGGERVQRLQRDADAVRAHLAALGNRRARRRSRSGGGGAQALDDRGNRGGRGRGLRRRGGGVAGRRRLGRGARGGPVLRLGRGALLEPLGELGD